MYGCRQTGQYHPFGFRFRRSRPVAVVPPEGAGLGTDDPVALTLPGTVILLAGVASAPSVAVVVVSSLRATLPPAPNSTIPTAQSRQTTRCRQGSRTTSRGEVRQTMHSLGVDAYGSASAVGGYEVGASL